MAAPPQQPDQMVRWLCMGQGHPWLRAEHGL